MYTYSLEKLSIRHTESEIKTGNDQIDYYWEKRYDFSEAKKSKYYVVENDENEVIGYMTLTPVSYKATIDGTEDTWPGILLGQLGVDREYRNQGVGYFLMESAILRIGKLLEQDDIAIKGLFLEINPASSNHDYLLETYYPKFGFIEIDSPRRNTTMFLDAEIILPPETFD